MNITKAGAAVPEAGLPAEELEAINAYARTTLTAAEVFAFPVLLCDNEVDRDFERFAEETLLELQELFVGKTGIADHDWSTEKQLARIYRTELIAEPGRKNSLGLPYQYLKGWAYMLRTAENASCIAEIQGGIKRETSVGCAIKHRICSICGKELGSPDCGHRPGQEYQGRLCFGELREATDAYEWSFVAVPAQRGAGVLKGRRGRPSSLKELMETPQARNFAGEYRRLEQEAALGRKYMEGLRREVLRLSLLCDEQLHRGLVKSSAYMDEGELLDLREAMETRLEDKLPPATQLPGREATTAFDGAAYQV